MSTASYLPSTVDRVPNNTADEYNQRIRQDMERRVAHYGRLGAAAIDRRLQAEGGAVFVHQLFGRILRPAVERAGAVHRQVLGHALRRDAGGAGVFPGEARGLLAPGLRL